MTKKGRPRRPPKHDAFSGAYTKGQRFTRMDPPPESKTPAPSPVGSREASELAEARARYLRGPHVRRIDLAYALLLRDVHAERQQKEIEQVRSTYHRLSSEVYAFVTMVHEILDRLPPKSKTYRKLTKGLRKIPIIVDARGRAFPRLV